MSELNLISMVQTDSSCSERGGEVKLRETNVSCKTTINFQ